MHIWIITTDFDDDVTDYVGNVNDVINFIETWDDYEFDSIIADRDNLDMTGTVNVLGGGKSSVSIHAKRINIASNVAVYMQELIDGMSQDNRDILADQLREGNSKAGYNLQRYILIKGGL